uniref:Disease resistance protein n=1 Tax=Quercus lobata TaxID=97700 RepID=A0A7N2RDT6_QUELO
MAEFVVSGVAERLGKLLLQEANFLSGVSHQVEMLQNELKLMQSFLKVADTKQDESNLVRQLVAQIRDLAYDAEDIIATYALKVGSRGVKRCACILGEGITVHQVGSKIDVIKTRISNLKQSFQDYGIEKSTIQAGRLSSLTETQREQRQTFSHPEHDVVGFNDGLNKLVNFLLKEEGGKRVASICGMGGLGKTTLAKMVYNNPKVKQHFNCCSWVYISQQCQRRPVLEEIMINLLSQSQKDEIQKSDEVDIIKKQKD